MCIVRIQHGEQQEVGEPQSVRALIVVGIYDPEDSNQGYKDTMTVIQKLYENFLRKPNLDNRYNLKFPVKWDYSEEDSDPYYFAWIDSYWEIPIPVNEQVEELI